MFVTLASQSNFSVERILSTMAQPPGKKKLTVTLLIMTIASLFMLLPFVLGLFKLFAGNCSGLFRSRLYVNATFVLSGANSFVNPILYTLRIPEFKKALISLFRRQRNENVAIPLQRY